MLELFVYVEGKVRGRKSKTRFKIPVIKVLSHSDVKSENSSLQLILIYRFTFCQIKILSQVCWLLQQMDKNSIFFQIKILSHVLLIATSISWWLQLKQLDKNSIFWFWNGKWQFKFFRDFWWIKILSKLKRTCTNIWMAGSKPAVIAL